MTHRRFAVAALLLAAATAPFGTATAQAPQAEPPVFVRNGLPGPNHERLNALVGEWQVEKATYIAVGTREKPAESHDLVARRRWIAGGRFLEDVTEGTVGGAPYFRQGFLGYSNIDRRYEWVTVDALNANMMIYHGTASGEATLDLAGEFTDQGVLGEKTVGKRIPMRTVIRIESPDRHVFELYMTPPGGKEILADRMIYTRRKP